jgi:SAM-dependent methyltransferase
MEYHWHPPKRPSLARWRNMTTAYSGQSILRMLQYEHLSKLTLSGKVLDMGGGRNAGYMKLLPPSAEVESVNIDAKIAPTHLVQAGEPLPYSDETFDAAICLNTLEHIYDSPAVLREIHRVIKPGAKVHVTVPFMFRIHGHPDDFHRATPSWWRETFARVGFRKLDFYPLVWGRASTRSSVPGLGGVMKKQRMKLGMLQDIASATLYFRGDTLSGRRGERICSTAPGWFMAGEK